MKNSLLIIAAILFSSFTVCAQYTIEGKIVSSNQNPIAYANVILHKTADSSLVKGTITDAVGGFKVQTPTKEAYFIAIRFVGYKPKRASFVADTNKNLGTVVLEEDLSELEAVELNVKNPEVVKLSDRLVFKIENTSLSSGSTWDVLKQTPGVISIQNSLRIKNSPATVYINNKKVYLSAAELQQLLESYSAENIKSIEVITNPPASYEAEGGPVLNIKTSKTLVPGYKGSVNAGYTQAIFPKYKIGTSHYYKTDKLNLFVNYSFNPKKTFKEDESYVNFIENQSVFEKWRTDFDKTTHSYAHNLNSIIDYNLDEKNRLSLNFTGLLSPNTDIDNLVKTTIYDAQNTIDSTFVTNSNLENKLQNIATDVSYTHTFEKPATELSASFHLTYYEQDKNQDVYTNYFLPDGNLSNTNNFSTAAKQKTNIYTGQVDFTTTFAEYTFESGAKISHINSDSQIDFYSINTDANSFENQNLNDVFLYDENVYAGYFSFAKDWEKFNAKIGLRLEHTTNEGVSETENTTRKRDYTELFPSVNLGYTISDKHSLAFTYGRKISRPRYESLNPFRYYLNENNYQAGNPNLYASISNNLNLNYTFKNSYSFDFYFRDNGENPGQLVFQDNDLKLLRSVYANMQESYSYGIDFFHGRSLNDWWYSQVILSLFHEEEEFVALESNNQLVTNETNGFYGYWYNSLTLSKDGTFSGDLSLLYISNLIQGSYQIEEMLTLSFGVRKTFLKGKLETSLRVADVLNQQATWLRSDYLNQDNGFFAQPENRYVQFGVKYKFGNKNLQDNQRSIESQERERL